MTTEPARIALQGGWSVEPWGSYSCLRGPTDLCSFGVRIAAPWSEVSAFAAAQAKPKPTRCRPAPNPPEIWLSPGCADATEEGRLWADEDAWGKCDGCDASSVRYVRGDLAAAQAKPEPDPAGVIPDELRVLSEDATPGPWRDDEDIDDRGGRYHAIFGRMYSTVVGEYPLSKKDRDFIVAAVNFVRQQIATPSPKPSVPDRAALEDRVTEALKGRAGKSRDELVAAVMAAVASPDVVRGEPDGGWRPIETEHEALGLAYNTSEWRIETSVDDLQALVDVAITTLQPASNTDRQGEEPDFEFGIGDLVEKFSGDYTWRGLVASRFLTPDGAKRYVVAHPVERGHVLHIYSPSNIRAVATEKGGDPHNPEPDALRPAHTADDMTPADPASAGSADKLSPTWIDDINDEFLPGSAATEPSTSGEDVVEGLLPCPFCGKAPFLLCTQHETRGYDREYTVRCDECGTEQNDEYRSGAIEAWNRRATPRPPLAEPVTDEEVEALARVMCRQVKAVGYDVSNPRELEVIYEIVNKEWRKFIREARTALQAFVDARNGRAG